MGLFEGILARLPEDRRLSQETCEFLDKEIRRGIDLNSLQREGILDIVKLCLEQRLTLPSPYESFWAYVYQGWMEQAKTSEEIKKKLAALVQCLKAAGPLASTVAQTAQHIQKERAARRQEMAKLAAKLAESAANPTHSGKGSATGRRVPQRLHRQDTGSSARKRRQPHAQPRTRRPDRRRGRRDVPQLSQGPLRGSRLPSTALRNRQDFFPHGPLRPHEGSVYAVPAMPEHPGHQALFGSGRRVQRLAQGAERIDPKDSEGAGNASAAAGEDVSVLDATLLDND